LKAKGLAAFFLFFGQIGLWGQVENPNRTPDSSPDPAPAVDTLPAGDSLPPPPDYPLSPDALTNNVDYGGRDSMIYNSEEGGILELYGDAFVTYTSIKLTAAHISYDVQNGIVEAEGMPDSSGQIVGTPIFEDGSQKFNAKRMRYNFRSQKGIVYGVSTTYNDITVYGRQSKFVSADRSDSLARKNDEVYSQGAIFTTCTHDEPHFGIRSNKQKVIPGKLVVVGPSNLEIMGVPTPLFLPFGFFPVTKQRSSGLLFPSDYEFSEQWGFGLRGVGWFIPLGQHANLAIRTNIYLKGTFGLNLTSQYRKRYKYSGNAFFGYDNRRNEDLGTGEVTRTQSFAIRWSHNQDRAAHPTNTFGGSINIQTNLFQSRDQNDADNVLENQLNSNLSFRKNWQELPIALALGFSHSQNNRSRQMTITFPDFNFRTQNIYPFKRPGGRQGPLESTVITYNADLKTRFTAADTALFSQETLENAQFGIRQRASLSNSIKLFRFINLNPSINYQEIWYLRTLEKTFDPTPEIEFLPIIADGDTIGFQPDTVGFGTVNEGLVTGFDSWRTMSASLTFNTQLFGTLLFKKGWLRGLRHTLKPSFSFSFTPDLFLDRYIQSVQTDIRDPDLMDEYNIFQGAIFGAPAQSGPAMLLSYSFNNVFEGKYFSKRDTAEKKFKIFDNIILNGSYNFVADSLNWSTVNIRGTHRLFKGLTTISLSTILDPYIVNKNNQRIDVTRWEAERRLLRFVNFTARFATSFSVGRIKDFFTNRDDRKGSRPGDRPEKSKQKPSSEFARLFDNFSLNHNLVLRLDRLPDGTDTFRISVNSINFRGNIALTDNWNIRVGNFGYDFIQKRLTYPSVGFYRDLHCWEMGLNWAPQRGTYQFFIRVKPGSMDFLKLPYDRNNADGISAF
jgi:hypothetical protein